MDDGKLANRILRGKLGLFYPDMIGNVKVCNNEGAAGSSGWKQLASLLKSEKRMI
jgi:hypothetical protein